MAAFFRKAEYDMGVVDMDRKGSDEMEVYPESIDMDDLCETQALMGLSHRVAKAAFIAEGREVEVDEGYVLLEALV